MPAPPSMAGFDPEFRDPTDYILGITERIWEGREVGNIRRWYADDIVLRAPTGAVRGNVAVLATTLGTLHEFPDRRLPGEDVIWTGAPQQGFLSSHRLCCWMTHTRAGAHGAATGRVARYRIIADCFVRENQVREEWLARDQAAIAVALGCDAKTLAQRQISAGDAGFYTPTQDPGGSYRARIDDSGPASIVADAWRRIWGERDLARLADHYAPAATLQGPGGCAYVGVAAIGGFCLDYLSAFPAGTFQVEHLFANQSAGRPTRVAMRWSLDAMHTGPGRFGEPTGRPVHVMGFTHSELSQGRVTSEWVVTDEVAIWKQVLAGEIRF